MFPHHRCMKDLFDSMKMTPEAPAILAPGRPSLTYGQLCDQVEYVTSFLNDHGLCRNDRIAVVLPNGPDMAVAFLGVIGGATFVPFNPSSQQQEYNFLLSNVNAKAVIVASGADSSVRTVALQKNIPVIELTPRSEAAGLFVLESGRAADRAAKTGFAGPDDTALVLNTSGTTSRAKIVPLTQSNIFTSSFYMAASLELGRSDFCLHILPMSHIAGLLSPLLSSLNTGGCVFCAPEYSAAAIFGWIKELRPTWLTAVPTIWQSLLEFAGENHLSVKGSSLRFIRSISFPLPVAMLEKLEHLFNVPLVETYGLTEATPIASNPMLPLRRKPGSVGLPIGPDVAVLDSGNNILPPGERGEIVVRGLNVMKGYENNPEANKGAFFGDWFRTGDEGYFDEDGYLYLSGRIKEVINRGGQKVAPDEVERILMGHPAVKEAVTFGVPHPSLGKAVVAAVVVDKQQKVTEKDLRRYASENLVAYKVPQQIVFIDSIPKGPTSKVQRNALAERLSHLLKPDYVPPETETEGVVANAWREVLGTEQVGRHDNFFALGGDSLSASRVKARLDKEMGITLPLLAVFQNATVAELSEHIETLYAKGYAPIHFTSVAEDDRETGKL